MWPESGPLLDRLLAALDQSNHFTGLGMPADRLFREHQLIVHRDLESAAAGRNHLDRHGVECVLELGRQPGGPGLVVSLNAVLDRNLHLPPEIGLLEREW